MNNVTITTDSTATSFSTSANRTDFAAAFERTAEERAKLTEQDVKALNVDIPSAVATALSALPLARTLRERYVPLFSAAEFAALDALDTYADALSFAHINFLAASAPVASLPDLFENASKTRDLFLSDASALAKRGIIDGKVLAQLKGGTGYLAVAYDLGAIVQLMRQNWAQVSIRSAVQSSELEAAEDLYEQVSRAVAERDQHSQVVTTASSERARAFTLFVNAYDNLRRAATFIRWQEGDADKYVPSIYAGRGGRGTPAPKPSPSSPVVPEVTAAPAPVATTSPTPGMPGGSPFTS